ncbi:MAG TPA: hypothetical protein VH814_25925 [Steroidobacteraceae bacterium]|jgi:hypothetical protein
MKPIVVTDQAAGTAGMKLVERPAPQAAINGVVVQVHASGFVPTELAWPSTWTDRLGRDHSVFGLTDWYRDGTLAEYAAVGGAQSRAAAGRRRLHSGRESADLGPDCVAGIVRARPSSRGTERPRAWRGRRGRVDGEATRTRLRTNIGNFSSFADAVAAFNPTERRKGKTIICVRP